MERRSSNYETAAWSGRTPDKTDTERKTERERERAGMGNNGEYLYASVPYRNTNTSISQ